MLKVQFLLDISYVVNIGLLSVILYLYYDHVSTVSRNLIAGSGSNSDCPRLHGCDRHP